MHKVANYGSFLQAYALKQIIKSYNCDVSFIEIKKGIPLEGFERSARLYFQKITSRFFNIHGLKSLKFHLKLRERFNRDFIPELIERKVVLKEKYDIVVIGSDEVFNLNQPTPWGFSRQLFGDIEGSNKIISYAGSFGSTTMKFLESHNLKDSIKESLQKILQISVRDENSFQIVSNLLNKRPQIHIDPVLLYDFSKEYRNTVNEKDYILIYSYPNRISKKEEIKEIVKFAKKYNKKLISIGFFFPWCDQTITPHPFEVLCYFEKADFIITDTFHGSIMAIKSKKRFGTIVRETNSEKLTFLLESFGLESRKIKIFTELENTLLANYDFERIDEFLKSERKKAKEYLKHAIES